MDLPKRNVKEFPRRKTFCHSEEVGDVLRRLDMHGYNVPQILRNAVNEYIEKNKLKELVTDLENESLQVNQNKLESTIDSSRV
jgi:hypothetical protein